MIYVTSHGNSAKGRNPYDTSISCWDNQSIKASAFASWLNDVPSDIPVIMVMAQCYCGGFAHTIFNRANRDSGLADGIRVGFFAQQHDLAAAGCRPDIENDEEYSSFFWGAFLGRSRSGNALESVDADSDGKISFAEAHACALLTSNTIDIPLRATEALLRNFSRIADYEHRGYPAADDENQEHVGNAEASTSQADAEDRTFAELSPASSTVEIVPMSGTLSEICRSARADLRHTVVGLAKQLDIPLDTDVTDVFAKLDAVREQYRILSRGVGRGRRSRGSGRRELREAIADRWPELGDRDHWEDSDLLAAENQLSLMEEIKSLAAYRTFVERAEQRQASSVAREQMELKQVKYQRLVNTLEIVLLAENLPKIADPAIVDRYNKMLSVEESWLNTM